MKKQFAKLKTIENNELITKEEHFDFICNLEKAVLLALRAQGRLDAMQYRYAEEKLKQRRVKQASRAGENDG